MIALTSLGSDATVVRSPIFWGLLLLCLAIGWLFVRQEKRAQDPMLDFAIAVRPPFLQVNLYNLLYGMGIFSVMAFVPYFAETRFGMSPAETGLLLTPRSVMMIVMSTVIMLAMTLAGAGMGTSAPAANNAGIALMPRQAAAIAGLRAMIRSLGGVLGQGIIVVIMELAPERTLGLRYSFVGFGMLLLLSLPIVLTIPDSVREQRRKRAEEAEATATALLEPGR